MTCSCRAPVLRKAQLQHSRPNIVLFYLGTSWLLSASDPVRQGLDGGIHCVQSRQNALFVFEFELFGYPGPDLQLPKMRGQEKSESKFQLNPLALRACTQACSQESPNPVR